MSWKLWFAAGAAALALGCASPGAEDAGERRQEPPARVTREPPALPVSEGPLGSGEDGGTGAPGGPVTLPPPGSLNQVPAGYPTVEFNVRLQGDDTQSADALLLNVSRLRAVAKGMELQVTQVQGAVDLAYEGSPWLVGKVKVPVDAAEVSFALELDDFGGYQRGLEAGAVDARRIPIAWTSSVDALRQRGQAVVRLDVGRSLVETPGGFRLLPQLEVEH